MCSLPEETITGLIAENAISINYKKGQDVFVEGEIFRGVFCIEKGNVKLFRSCNTRSLTLGLAGNSDMLGFMGFFNGEIYKYSAQCLVDTQICFIPKKIFVHLLSSCAEFSIELLRRSAYENCRLSTQIKELKCGSMLSRVSGTLLDIESRFGVNNNNYLNLVLTRKEIAEISGTTTESAIRILNQLKKEGAINVKKNQIKIIDSGKLKQNIPT